MCCDFIWLIAWAFFQDKTRSKSQEVIETQIICIWRCRKWYWLRWLPGGSFDNRSPRIPNSPPLAWPLYFCTQRIREPTGPQRSPPVAVNVMPPAGGQVVSLLLIFRSKLGRKQGIKGQGKDRREGMSGGWVVSLMFVMILVYYHRLWR